MKFDIITGDLFDYAVNKNSKSYDGNNRIPVHCISADFAMGGGIAVPMARKYDLRQALKSYMVEAPACIFTNNVMNLITKNKVWHKPTYTSLKESLFECRRLCEDNNIRYLVMPKIGCGIDGLDWATVKIIIESVFEKTDVDILVCVL